MDEEIVVTAYTEAQAVQLAARLLGRAEGNARVETVNPGRPGFLFIGRRPAVFRVRWTPEEEPQEASVAGAGNVPTAKGAGPVQAVPGQTLVEVRDGALHVHPGSPAMPAYIQTSEGIRLLIDGEEAAGVIPVTGRESIAVRIEPSAEETAADPGERERGFTIEVTQDRMRAVLRLHPVITLRLKDVPPAPRVRLEPRVEYHLPPALSVDTVVEELRRLGVVHGVDRDALAAVIANPTDRPVTIASGNPPEPGRDGWLEQYVDTEFSHIHFVENGDRIDYRQRPELPFYPAGTPLFRIHPPERGKPGRDVFGGEVPAPEARTVSIRCGTGVIRKPEADGTTTILARHGGRPVLRQITPFSFDADVYEVYRHPGDVDMHSGNLSYHGDIWIAGQVTEGMSVTAGGNVTVMGMVSGGSIAAGGNIEACGGISQGRLIAGYQEIIVTRLRPLLATFEERLGLFEQALTQLQQAAMAKALPPGKQRQLAQALLSSRFPDLRGLARKIVEALDEYHPHHRAVSELATLEDALRAWVRPGLPDSELDLTTLRRALTEAQQAVTFFETVVGNIIATHANNASLIAGGRITILQQGTYYARLKAGKDIKCYGPIIGGWVEAQHTIRAAEAGSVGEAPTWLRVGPRGAIRLTLAHPNVGLQIGTAKQRLVTRLGPLHARLQGRRIVFAR